METHVKKKAVVLGGGSWGTALAHVLAHGDMDVSLIVRNTVQAQVINAEHINPRYVQGVALHKNIKAYTSATACLPDADYIVLAIPCQYLRSVLQYNMPFFAPHAVIVNTCKGIEMGTNLTPCGLVQEECGSHIDRYASLSGPSFALEVLRGKATAVVLACTDEKLGSVLRECFSTPWFRIYSSTDVLGVELGGALKNVIALGTGISDGLGFGDNARAAFITRGLAEMSRLGLALGAHAETFMGLSGLGDLMLTCAGELSRNRAVGVRIGRGEALESIVRQLGMVAEGVSTVQAVHLLAEAHNVDMPVTQAVYNVLYRNLNPLEAVEILMQRPRRHE